MEYLTYVLFTFTISCLSTSFAANCTSRGRFPNDDVADCRGYTTCLAGASNVFYKYDLACPENFIYNHIDNQCSNAMYYTCLPTYNCTELGNFANTQSSNCSSYIACIKGLDETIVNARLVECDPDLFFSPVEEKCVNTTMYKCPVPTDSPTDSPTTPTLEILGENEPGDNDKGKNEARSFNVAPVSLMLFIVILLLL